MKYFSVVAKLSIQKAEPKNIQHNEWAFWNYWTSDPIKIIETLTRNHFSHDIDQLINLQS